MATSVSAISVAPLDGLVPSKFPNLNVSPVTGLVKRSITLAMETGSFMLMFTFAVSGIDPPGDVVLVKTALWLSARETITSASGVKTAYPEFATPSVAP